MPPLTVTEFGVPVGTYLVRFLGAAVRAPQQGAQAPVGQDGRPMPPGLEWTFEVLEGQYAGTKTTRTTAAQPTAKNSCTKFITMMTGGAFQPHKGSQFDPDAYIGRTFNAIVATNSTGNGTRVESVMPASGGPAGYGAQAPAPQQQPPHQSTFGQGYTNPPPPVYPPADMRGGVHPLPPQPTNQPSGRIPPPPPQQLPEQKFWVVFPGAPPTDQPTLMPRSALVDTIRERLHDPRRVQVCAEGQNVWRTADKEGFEDPVPI
jgi:hypothetical protein